ncbi:MAG: preprotein translocase subunit SecE [Bacillales bacterium]|jgi:preprotein translocase SecE subunit|nr:preprotein translocase subunit SecE [Bacillales bacterium]
MNKIKRYFVGVWTEMRRVRWPRAIDLLADFVQVIIFVGFFALVLFGFDLLVLQMLKAVGIR